MNDGERGCLDNKDNLQGDMLKLLGEIIGMTSGITSIKELASMFIELIILKTDIDNCYLWYENEHSEGKDYSLFYRSVQGKNEFKEKKDVTLPIQIRNKEEVYLFNESEITSAIIRGVPVPKSRLSVPLKRCSDERILGRLVVEHMDSHFFEPTMISFFETLSTFMACKIENSRLLKSVSEKSIKDPLTGIYNRRHLKSLLKKLKTEYSDITVAIVDTDNFKLINDKLGHIEGDNVLTAIAQLAKGIVRDNEGEVIRYGGDEFVILLPKPLRESVNIFEEFRKCVQYLKIPYNLATDVSVTLGVCAYPEITKNYNELIKSADKALLRGKEEGKNRIIIASKEDILAT